MTAKLRINQEFRDYVVKYNHNFVSYQVEILDWKTKEQLCFLDKVKQKPVQNAR